MSALWARVTVLSIAQVKIVIRLEVFAYVDAHQVSVCAIGANYEIMHGRNLMISYNPHAVIDTDRPGISNLGSGEFFDLRICSHLQVRCLQ